MERVNDLLKMLADDNVQNICDKDDNIILSKDYESERIILSNELYLELIDNDGLSKLIEYLKSNTNTRYMTYLKKENDKVFMVDILLTGDCTYLVPMNYENDDNDLSDDTIHYSKEALNLEDSKEGKDILIGKQIRFSTIRNKDDAWYIPLFKSSEELRLIFPKNKYRIASISYNEAVKLGKEFSGIVFRPTKESFIVLNNVSELFSGILEYKKPYRDYRKYTTEEKNLLDKFNKMGMLDKGSKEASLYYRGLLQNIHDLDKLYVSLSREDYKIDKGVSKPLVSDKDNEPAIYLFTDLTIAKSFAEHYNNKSSDNKALIGEILKADNYDSVFQIASRLGINLCMMNEGNTIVGFDINLFLDVNDMSREITLLLNEEEAKKVMNSKGKDLNLSFNRCILIDIEKTISEDNYKLVIK